MVGNRPQSISPLFKKLVDNYTFGELHIVAVKEGEGKPKIIEDNLYPVIRKGKIIRWERMF